MQNFDVKLNLLPVNKAPLVVLTMCLALLNGAKRCAAYGSNVGKSCQRVEKHFSSIPKHF